MADLVNEFSWSWSRHRTFHTCKRRYWLTYYGSWGGWDGSSAAPAVREAYIQKQLNNRPQWVGKLVHEAAEWVLGEVRRGNYPAPEAVVARYLRLARRQIDESGRGLYRANPKRFPGFIEHYYEQEPEGSWDESLALIERLVSGMFEHPVFLRLTDVPERICEVERLEQVVIGDVPVWVSLDALVSDGSGGFVVVDWKTGAQHDPDRVREQLGVYAAYVLERYLHVPPLSAAPRPVERIKTLFADLRHCEHHVFVLGDADLQHTLDALRESAAGMRARLVDPQSNTAREGDFEPLPEGEAECCRCHFRGSCGRQ